MLRLVQTFFTKTASAAVKKPTPAGTFFSRGMHTKVNPSAEIAQAREAYEEACERVWNQRAAFTAKQHYDKQFIEPWTENSLVTRESHAAWRKIEQSCLEKKLDDLYPFPPKPPGL